FGMTTASFASAMANNAIGDYQAALRSAEDSGLLSTLTPTSPSADSPRGHRQTASLLPAFNWCPFSIEVAEAAARCGRAEIAAAAHPAAPGSGAGAPSLRRMVTPRTPTHRRAHRASR